MCFAKPYLFRRQSAGCGLTVLCVCAVPGTHEQDLVGDSEAGPDG